MKRRIISVLVLVVVLVSSMSYTVLAKNIYRDVPVYNNHTWSSSVRCTLKKNLFGKPKEGHVLVTAYTDQATSFDVRMKSGGRVIWSENNAITPSKNKKGYFSERNFRLGKDHSYYDLQFRINKTTFPGRKLYVSMSSNSIQSFK